MCGAPLNLQLLKTGEKPVVRRDIRKGTPDDLSLRGASGLVRKTGEVGAASALKKHPIIDKNPGEHSTQTGFMNEWAKGSHLCLQHGRGGGSVKWRLTDPFTDWEAFRRLLLTPSSHLPLREDNHPQESSDFCSSCVFLRVLPLEPAFSIAKDFLRGRKEVSG